MPHCRKSHDETCLNGLSCHSAKRTVSTTNDEFENIAQEKPALLASPPPGERQEWLWFLWYDKPDRPSKSRASVKLAAEVNPEDLYWQAAIITDKEVALEDHGGDNTAQLTRCSDLVVQFAQSLAAEIPVCMYRVQ